MDFDFLLSRYENEEGSRQKIYLKDILKISNGKLTDYQIKELIPILKGLDGKPLKDVILSFKESDYAHLVIPILIESTNIIGQWDNPGISFNSQNTIFILYARSSDIDLLATALNHSSASSGIALFGLGKLGNQTAADIIVKWAIEKKNKSASGLEYLLLHTDLISILENLGHESCIKFLVEVIQKSDEYNLSSVYNCAVALGNIGSKDALTPLIRFFFDQLDDTTLWEMESNRRSNIIKLAKSIVKLGGGKEIIGMFHQQLLPENVVTAPGYYGWLIGDVIEIIVSVGHSESVVYFMELIDYIQKNSQGDGSIEYRILKILILALGELKDISAIGFLTEFLEESIEIMNIPESKYHKFSLGQFAVLAIGRIKEGSQEYQGVPIETIRDISKRSDDFLQGSIEKSIRSRYTVETSSDENFIPKPGYIRNTSLRINSIFALGLIGDIKSAQHLIELLLLRQDLSLVYSLSKVIDPQSWRYANLDSTKIEEIRKEIILIERRISHNLSTQYPNKKFEISGIEVNYLDEEILLHVILESLMEIIRIHDFSEVIEQGLTKFMQPLNLDLKELGYGDKIIIHYSNLPKIRYEDLQTWNLPRRFGGITNPVKASSSKRKKYSLNVKAEKILKLMAKNKKKIEKTTRKPLFHRARLLKKRRK